MERCVQVLMLTCAIQVPSRGQILEPEWAILGDIIKALNLLGKASLIPCALSICMHSPMVCQALGIQK